MKDRIKILWVTNALGCGGAERQMLYMYDILRKYNNIDVTILYYARVGDELNINNYIGKRKFTDSTSTENDITIKILEKNTYKDYENYTIEVTNNTDNTIYLDDGEDTSTIYIEDSNGVKHEAASSEIIYSTLTLMPGQTKRYTIKFTNTYITNREITSMTFDKVILNYDEYLTNTENYEDTISITINI